MTTTNLKTIVLNALNNLKAHDINTLEVGEITSITDHMIVATGTSTRHVKAIADNVIKSVKSNAHQPLGVEGANNAEWILIDLGDIIVHIMLAQSREFYQLDKLWAPLATPAIAIA